MKWSDLANVVGVQFLFFVAAFAVSPIAITPSKTQTALQGSDVVFTCTAGPQITGLTWLKRVGRRTHLPVNRRKVQTIAGSIRLTLKNVAIGDKGRYRCRGIKNGRHVGRTAKLKVKRRKTPKPFKFKVVPRRFYTVGLSSNFVLDCSTNDPKATTTLYFRPRPGMKWAELPPRPGKVLRDDHTFTIVYFGLRSAGQYQCRATNRARKTITGETMVFVRPNIIPDVAIEPRHAVVLSTGDSFNFTCSSALRTKLKWIKLPESGGEVDVPLNQTASATDLVRNEATLVLMIKNAQPSDSSVYKCLMTYSNKHNYKLASLTVYKPRNKPQVRLRRQNRGALSCSAIGRPIPTLTWLRDGQPITCTTRVNRICAIRRNKVAVGVPPGAKRARSTLRLFGKQRVGRYTCVATNVLGTAQAHIQL